MRLSRSKLPIPAVAIVALVAMATFTLEVDLHFAARAGRNPSAALQLSTPHAEQPRELRPMLSSLPLAFECNQGQADPGVRYLAHAERYTLFLTTSEVLFALNPLTRTPTAINQR